MHNNIDKLDSRYTAETPLQILLVDCRHSLDRTISRSYRIEIQETLTQWKHTDSGQKKQKEDGKGRDDTFDRIMEEDLANQLKLLEIQELKDTEGQSRLATRKPSERIARQEEKYYPASHQRCRPTPSPYRQPERKPIGNHGIKKSSSTGHAMSPLRRSQETDDVLAASKKKPTPTKKMTELLELYEGSDLPSVGPCKPDQT